MLDLAGCSLFFLRIYQRSYAFVLCIPKRYVLDSCVSEECCFQCIISLAFGFRYVSPLRGFILSFAFYSTIGRQVLTYTQYIHVTRDACGVWNSELNEWMLDVRQYLISIINVLDHRMIRFVQSKLLYYNFMKRGRSRRSWTRFHAFARRLAGVIYIFYALASHTCCTSASMMEM